MSKNSSSASRESIMPAGKPSKSFMTESEKSGALGSDAISVKEGSRDNDTSKDRICEDYSSPSGVLSSVEEMSPAGKPGKTFINTSAVK